MLLRVGISVIVLVIVILFGTPVLGAPQPQAADDTVVIQAQSAITLTLTMKDGAIYLVPLALDLEAVQGPSGATVDIVDVMVDHRNNYLVEVENSGPAAATVLISRTLAYTETAAMATPDDAPNQGVANRNANLRSGPGTGFAVVGSVAAGDELIVVGQNDDGSWLVLEDGAWIAAFLVDGLPNDVPTVTPTATPQPSPTPRPTATPTPQPTNTTRPTPMQTATQTATPEATVSWYNGGTLHEATWAEWQQATDANKLATAADWITNAYKPEWQTLDELRGLSLGLIACLDEVEDTAIAAYGADSTVTDFVILCVLMMMEE